VSGIAGIQHKESGALITAMLDKLGHRGPNGRAISGLGNATFGATLLSVGPEASAGPLVRDRLMIVWDGELYDPDGVREATGLDAATDVELVLRLYDREGTDFLSWLNGPFALAILAGDKLLLARDPMGQAPLYFGTVKGSLCFASEIKALQEATEDIHIFPPGHLMVDGEIRPGASRGPERVADSDPGAVADTLRLRMEASIRRRVAKVPRLGVWLSGGLDSSVLAALAAAESGSVSTFSAGTAGASDLAFAREVASFLGTDHHERLTTVEEMLEVLPRVIYHLESFDAPLVRSSVANYIVAGEASRHVRVVLSGEGGDELFAGYGYMKDRDSDGLRSALLEAQRALHNTALQRVDRMAAAHGTRARTAFLDPGVVAYANAIPDRWKIFGEKRTEKWILRKAMEGRLPEGVLWRPKEKFWSGSGIAGKLAEVADRRITDAEFSREREVRPGHVLETKEDLFYWRIFRRYFPHVQTLDSLGWTAHREIR
jgi:asparagine synthase (glutamine-hydrolysing)